MGFARRDNCCAHEEMTSRTSLLALLLVVTFACNGQVERAGPQQESLPSGSLAAVTPNRDAEANALYADGETPQTSLPSLTDSGTPEGSLPPPEAALDPMTLVQDVSGCVPWSSVRGHPFVAVVDAGRSLATLNDVQMSMVGSFVGHVASPWGDWDLLITFTADGYYAASSYDGTTLGPSSPFYYGPAPGCESLDQWRLLDVSVTGAASGQLDVPYLYGQQGCGLPGWQGVLSEVSVDATGNRMHFDFGRSDGYGPIVYDSSGGGAAPPMAE